MIFYEILTGKKLFEGKSEKEVKEKVINGQIPELPLEETKEEAKLIEIIRKCLSKDPFERLRPFMLLNDLLKGWFIKKSFTGYLSSTFSSKMTTHSRTIWAHNSMH